MVKPASKIARTELLPAKLSLGRVTWTLTNRPLAYTFWLQKKYGFSIAIFRNLRLLSQTPKIPFWSFRPKKDMVKSLVFHFYRAEILGRASTDLSFVECFFKIPLLPSDKKKCWEHPPKKNRGHQVAAKRLKKPRLGYTPTNKRINPRRVRRWRTFMNRGCDPESGGFLGSWWQGGSSETWVDPMSGVWWHLEIKSFRINAVHQVTGSPKTSRLIQKVPPTKRRLHPLTPSPWPSAGSENMGVSSPGFWAAFSNNFRFYRSVYRLPYFSKYL